MGIHITPPTTVRERMARLSNLITLRQQGHQVGGLAQMFWTLAAVLGYNDACLIDLFNGCLDDSLPSREIEGLGDMDFWGFVYYLEDRGRGTSPNLPGSVHAPAHESVPEVTGELVIMMFSTPLDGHINKEGKCLSLTSKMAEARYSQDEFTCPVCLDLLKDPVTITCGHSYCMSCITDCWDQEDEKRVYSCPQCRQTFSPRPALGKNTILAELVEKLKKTKLPADCYAGAGDVPCDVCTGRKYKAVKSCLVCQESYCQTHFDRHEEFHSRKPHKVIDATGRLQDMICRKHDKELEMYCITDQQCICVWCKESKHKKHKTVTTAAQRKEKQKQLNETQMKMRQRIQQRQKDVQQLREDLESHKRSAQTAVEDSERIFTELIRSIERSRSEVTQQIRDQEEAAVSRAEGRLERLEQEINDLRRRDAELEQLSQTHHHIHFLQSFQSLSAPPESTDEPDDPFSSLFSFDGMRESVCQLRDKLEDFCKEEIKKISDRGNALALVVHREGVLNAGH
ncbi:Tripartite motif-containing protein 47 [Anabarilius grahami]|uniref:Tripartite motif-containing protein 47 n=1 Tax=Anabarilius grahami TaxID=495550 RepID=A0A3N0YUA1_ANAGA|nr:Tripartite motif-containing protein 47 [Anabarilius grahami]